MGNTSTLKPHPAQCSWCEKDFEITKRAQLGALRAGRSVFCSPRCQSASSRRKAKGRHTLGPCPTCGKMFTSHRREKIFCCMRCYTSHPSTTERLRSMNDAKRSGPKACPHCKKAFQHKSNRYCSDACRRKFFAARFDRWVANPEQIALPQNFDEFMAADILPCLIEGCDWHGENLANHVNFAHGISADDFRELVGFNKSTGLIGAALRTKTSERIRAMIEDGTIVPDLHAFDNVDRSAPRPPQRLEAKEHHLKARAIMAATGPDRPPKPCLQCGRDVAQPTIGRTLYCSTVCRSLFYQKRGQAELRCDYCGKMFTGERAQVLRAQRSQKVCCSTMCRNKMNMVACLAARGITWSEANGG